jgi:glutaminase
LFAVLDFKRVTHIDPAAAQMLAALVSRCAERGQQLVLTRVRRGEALGALERELDPRAARALVFQPQLDGGLEWCERGLLKRAGVEHAVPAVARLGGHSVCDGVGAADIDYLETLVTRSQFEPGTLLARRGDPADAVYFLMRGEVSVVVDLAGGGQKRLSTLTAGMSFGELGLLSGAPRSADVRADTLVECGVLNAEALARIERERPALAIRLLRNLLRVTIGTAVQLTAEVAALEA